MRRSRSGSRPKTVGRNWRNLDSILVAIKAFNLTPLSNSLVLISSFSRGHLSNSLALISLVLLVLDTRIHGPYGQAIRKLKYPCHCAYRNADKVNL